MPKESAPLDGMRRRVAAMGSRCVPPVWIVWGRQQEPLRRYGAGLLAVRNGLFDGQEELLTALISRALADPTVGTEWAGTHKRKRKKGIQSINGD